jgi:hypothetical protein
MQLWGIHTDFFTPFSTVKVWHGLMATIDIDMTEAHDLINQIMQDGKLGR